MGLALEAKKQIATFIEGAQQRLLGSEGACLSQDEYASSVRVLDALVTVFADGDEKFAQALELALEEHAPSDLVDWERDDMVSYYLEGGDAAPEDLSGPDRCKHGNRVGSAPGGEHICGRCESGE